MIRHNALRASLLAGLLAGLVALPAVAQQQAASGLGQSGLGQLLPQAKNVSAAPGWRVYVFVQDRVKYIQAKTWSARYAPRWPRRTVIFWCCLWVSMRHACPRRISR